MIDLELTLVKAFGWSLRDIDETDVESLLPFIARFNGSDGTGFQTQQKVFCDQVEWL
jgi:hypothetical protein